MKIKYIISLSMLVALIGAQCWGAAENDEQRATGINDVRPAELFAQQEAQDRSALSEMPREIIVEQMLAYLSAANLMNLAVVRPDVYPFIKEIPRFIQLQQNMERELGKHAKNKQKIFLSAAHRNYPGAVDVIDYLAPDVNINMRDNYDYTALMRAAKNNYLEMVKQLLANGVDINARDKYGDTALMSAAANNNLEIAELLLAKEADINVQDRNGDTALNFAERNLTRFSRINDQDYQRRAQTILDLLIQKQLNP